jgi:hypothetical protein
MTRTSSGRAPTAQVFSVTRLGFPSGGRSRGCEPGVSVLRRSSELISRASATILGPRSRSMGVLARHGYGQPKARGEVGVSQRKMPLRCCLSVDAGVSNGRSRKEDADYDQEGAGVDVGLVGSEGELVTGLFAWASWLQMWCSFIWGVEAASTGGTFFFVCGVTKGAGAGRNIRHGSLTAVSM